MARNSRQAYGATGETKVLHLEPERLTLVKQREHVLYDKRVELPVDEALVESIMAVGILQPIGIHKDTESGEILVVWGRQRVKAALEANKRLKKQKCEPVLVPCVVRRGNEGAELLGLSITENELRQNDTPLGRAEKMRRLLEMGRSETQLATTFGVTTATVKNTLALLEATADVRRAVDTGKLSASVAYRLAKEEPGEQRRRLKKILKESPAPVGERKRRSRGAGKKAREIATGVSEGRSKSQLEWMLQRLENFEEIKENDRKVATATLRWVLGDEGALSAFCDVMAEGEESEEVEVEEQEAAGGGQ
jgi:ParB family transcriptional regulator, chromosome partitioning protein